MPRWPPVYCRQPGIHDMGRYTLWCLNRVASWDLQGLANALALRGWLGGATHEVKLGDRSGFDADPLRSKLGVLSHEQHDINEYFVPIIVKCIGDPVGFKTRLGRRMGTRGIERFDALVDGFADFFGPAATNPWAGYWMPGDSECMFTASSGPLPHVGFYEIVAKRAEVDGEAILVGYSQGGLVARFLAFLDEYLMPPKARCIRGFITVQAPNSGSPLANPENARLVARGTFAVLSGVLAFPVPPVGQNVNLGAALGALARDALDPGDGLERGLDVAAICALLAAAADDARTSGSELREDMVRTARKWLTGLSPVRAAETAFGDLNPEKLDDPRSVLGLLERSPPTHAFHGAVIGANNGLSDFVSSGRPWWMRLALRYFAGKAGFADAIRAAERAYKQIVMDEWEDGRSLSGREAAVADAYRNGCHVMGVTGASLELPPYAHDFVIPSISHALGPRSGDPPLDAPASAAFLGNYVNPKATHISGGARPDKDSCSDEPFVKNLLGMIGERLS